MNAVANAFTPQSLRVLLFEDNPLDAALIKKFLLTVGMRSTNIHHVDTIPSALQVLTRERIDICLADYYLRPSTGFDLMDEARRYDFDVPFIMLTAMDDRMIDEGALARGAYGFLVKGELTVEGLERSIRYTLMHHARESTLARDALIDGLTGLPNRKAFLDRLSSVIADNAGRKGMVAVAIFNLNGTKFLNESHGVKVGDDVIRAAAAGFQRHKRSGDFLARIGGDEFAVLMTDLVLPGHAATHAKALADALTGTVATHDGRHDLTLAGGVASLTAPKAGDTEAGGRLMATAAQAMFNAKLIARRGGTTEVAVAHLQ